MLYGRGSSGGLINRVTKKPKFGEPFGEVSTSFGSYGLKRVETDLNTQPSESVTLRLNLARKSSGSYRSQQFNDRYSIAPSLALSISADTKLLLHYNQATDKRLTDFGIPSLNGRPVDVPVSTYYGSSTARKDDTTTSHVLSYSATLDHRLNEALSLHNTTRFSDYKLDRYNTNASGLANPVALTVQLSHGTILRDESGSAYPAKYFWPVCTRSDHPGQRLEGFGRCVL